MTNTTIPTLRDYQQDLADNVRDAYRQGFRFPLVVLSTGGGKTILFSYITASASKREGRTMIVAHRRELIRQISMSLAKFGVVHRVIAPPQVIRKIQIAQWKQYGRAFVDATAPTIVGSVQTIVRRFDTIHNPPTLIILDEGHHVVSDTMWGRIIDEYQNARGLIVTATPERLDGKGLGKTSGGYADTMIEGPDMGWLIENGYLSPYRCFTTRNPVDLAGVRTVMGDYDKTELNQRVDKPSITGDAVEHYKKAAAGMLAAVYCVSVEHSQHVAAMFNAAGIPAAHFDADTKDDEREQIISAFADRKILVLCSVAILTEGFDLASIAQRDVTIDCVIDLAPTQSVALYLQKVGRCLRPAPNKTAVILDHAGNVLKHGLPDMERDWTLDGRKKRKRGKADDDGDVKVQTCGQCFAIHEPAPACPVCGFVHPVQAREVKHEDGQLVEITDAERDLIRREALRAQATAQTVDEMMQATGYSRARCEKILQAREEKQRAVEEIQEAMRQHQARTGLTPFQSFGVSLGAVRSMKPRELSALRARIVAFLPVEHEKVVNIRPVDI